MSGIESEIRRKRQAEEAKAKTREAMKREGQEAAGQDSRLSHYVEKEKAALKKGARDVEANRNLREG